MESKPTANRDVSEEAERLRSLYDRYPVNRWREEFRLLRIHPGDWNESISCELKVRSLDDVSSYTYCALSYVWGPKHPRFPVRIDNQDVLISANLHAALRRLRAHNKGHVVTLFADALCINQANVIERAHQVTLMGRIYSRCAEVIVWLGEIEKAIPLTLKFDHTSVPPTKSSARHRAACPCRRKQWLASYYFKPMSSPPNLIVMAAPILLRLARTKRCEDMLACRLFDTFEEMIAFRFLMDYISKNAWFGRMWTVQEGLLAETGSLYFGAVVVPFDVLFDLATAWEMHKTSGCCREWMSALDTVVAPVVRASFFLGEGRRRVREGHSGDLFAMRIEYPNRNASLDVDLLYGLLGITHSRYEITPDYSMSVEAVYTKASRDFLYAFPKYRSFWIFIYAPLKNRYKNMPSWTVDWTTLELPEYQNGRYTWTGLQCVHELGTQEFTYLGQTAEPFQLLADHPPLEKHGVGFNGNTMIIDAAYVDTIRHIGEPINDADSQGWYDRFYKVLDSWRMLVIAYHSPKHIYQPVVGVALPQKATYDGYDTLVMAWLKLLCAGLVPQIGCKWYKLSTQELRTILKDATHDATSPLLLYLNHSVSQQRSFMESRARMVFPRLYQQVVDFVPQLLEGKKIFVTSHGYIGFGNAHTAIGDKVSGWGDDSAEVS